MHILVCLQQILDPEIPAADFRLDPALPQAAAESASRVISIFDENALEVALQLRDGAGEGKITAVSLGPPECIDALRKALSLRADQAIRIRQEDFPQVDAYAAARVLAAAARKLEPVDLVLCGRETGDWHGGVVGGFLAAELGWPCVNFTAGIRRRNGSLEVRRQTDDGWELLDATPPAVATITNDDGNLPRLPKVKDNMMAFRKAIPEWGAADLRLDPAAAAGPNAALQTVQLFIPVDERQCQMIAGETVQDRAAQLVRRLAELQVI